MIRLQRLWSGDLALDEAFWTYAVLYGVALNLTTSLLFLTLISADWPITALLLGYGLSLPYNVLALVGVWRAAAREGPSPRADLYRALTLVGMVILSLT